MNFPKVLVAAPINERKSYCIEDYLENVSKLTYPNKGYFFSDNSERFMWHREMVVSQGYNCGWVTWQRGRNQDYICASQNQIRGKAIRDGYDFLYMQEVDIFTPHDIIEQLISYNAPVVSAQYFIGQKNNVRLLKMEIENPDYGIYTNRNISATEGYLEQATGESRSSMFGFGCVLIKREIFERFPFRVDKNDVSHSDTFFYMDLHEQGIKVTLHNVFVTHKNSSWDKVLDT